jgi:hypothetical protein
MKQYLLSYLLLLSSCGVKYQDELLDKLNPDDKINSDKQVEDIKSLEFPKEFNFNLEKEVVVEIETIKEARVKIHYIDMKNTAIELASLNIKEPTNLKFKVRKDIKKFMVHVQIGANESIQYAFIDENTVSFKI